MTKHKRLAVMQVVGHKHFSDGPHFWYRLDGANGQTMFVSETFARKADARRAMRRALAIIQAGQYKVIDP